MWSIIVLSSFLCVNCTRTCNKNDNPYPDEIGNQPDYYWRDYLGVVPRDAVPGGYDESGNVTYIGQTYSANHSGIYPATVYPGQKEAAAAIAKKVVDGTYVKILCSNPANKFEWIKTSVNDYHTLTDYHFVVGGAVSTNVCYIGRANFEDQVQVGRVFITTKSFRGLWVYNRNGTEINLWSFELLVLPK